MFQTKTAIQKLQESSQNALGAFNKIVTDLTNSNSQIETESDSRIKEIQRLDDELKILTDLKKSNVKVINKINKFLQDED